MKSAARLIGVFMLCLGILGMSVPSTLFEAARAAQSPPLLYVAAGVRIAIGIVFYSAAPGSRAPILLVVIGAIIFTSGLLTPFAGAGAAQLILDWWNQTGTIVVHAFALLAMTLGALIIYAALPARSRA